MTLPFSVNEDYHRDNFIIHQGNRFAHQLVTEWPHNWGVAPYPNILILRGEDGTGKSYHANLFAQHSKALFLSHGQLITHEDTKYYKAFIIDDAHHEWQEHDLFHNLNLCWQYATYLLITMTPDCKFHLPDLVSRLNSIRVVALEHPDLESLKQIVFGIFANKSLQVPLPVIDYMLARLPRNIHLIKGCVEQIEQLALASKQKITIPLVKKIILRDD